MRRKKTEKSKPYLLLGRTNAAHEAAPWGGARMEAAQSGE
jgi:hypothetical protein